MVVLVIITLFFIIVLSRHLTRSISALHQGALAFRNDDLSYRIPELSELEFQRLGEAFNTMAIQLSEHREQLRDTNIQLEATVDERTRELQESNRKLAAVDVNRRKLLANISHEFRTPLTVIRGEAEIALRGSNKTKQDYRESFRRIIDQADNATRLVDDLLFIARADAGEPRLKLSSVAIAGMIDAVCQEFSVKAEKRGIKIEQGRLDAKAVVQGDAGRLRQVFAILMENALRYSNPGGRVEIQVLQENENVEIIFRDEGIGLTEEQSELAFERFYRAPKAEEQAAGTGLGLPVAKAIVEAHHGIISLSGKLDQGATATVVLPVGRQFGIICMRILIVEDEKHVADFLDRGLRAEGHFCVVASDGEQGLKLALEGEFDLILLDLVLPRMHGHEVCQQLRMNKVNTPLMILTAMDSVDDVIVGLRLGADDYMTKPFSFEELLARIEARDTPQFCEGRRGTLPARREHRFRP